MWEISSESSSTICTNSGQFESSTLIAREFYSVVGWLLLGYLLEFITSCLGCSGSKSIR